MNLLDIVKDQVSGSLVSQASKFLGASEDGVGKAMDGIFPALLGKVISNSEEEGGAQKLFNMVSDMDMGGLDDISGLFGGGASNVAKLMNSGSGILSSVMGNSSNGLIDTIAKFSGLKGSAASSLLKMAAPFLMSIIGKQIKAKALDAVGLGKLLGGQKSFVKNAMPSGLLGSLGSGLLGKGFSSIMGLAGDGVDLGKQALEGATNLAGDAVGGAANLAGNTVDLGKKAVGGAADLAGNAADTAVKTGGSLLKWLLPALLVLAALGYFGIRTGCNAVDGAADKVVATTGDAVDAAGDAVAKTGEVVSKVGEGFAAAFGKIDDAAKAALDKITFTAGSVGSQMNDYISGGFKGNANFRFNNLTFETGSANIAADSRVEVDNLAAILKAYPGVKIKVTGYTDNTGDAAANVQLSNARAMAVKARLMSQSIDGSRIKTEGQGSANPVASNDTPEGRAQNRRIEVDILK